jgi:hypothetical protein
MLKRRLAIAGTAAVVVSILNGNWIGPVMSVGKIKT